MHWGGIISGLAFLILALWICAIDMREHRIPNLSLLLLSVVIEFHFKYLERVHLIHSHLLALAVLIFGFAINLTLRGAIGMGDIKLFSLLTLLTGHLESVLRSLIYACCIAWVWALTVRKQRIPFAPPLFLGFFIALVT